MNYTFKFIGDEDYKIVIIIFIIIIIMVITIIISLNRT